ncbi:MAG: transporter substrate-binding domain-containing protein [Christensenellales bacterium]
MKKSLLIILALVLVVGSVACLAACNKTKTTAAMLDIDFGSEEYGIAAAKGNEALIEKVNEALIGIADDAMLTVADKFGLKSELLIKSDTENPISGAADDSWNNIVSKGKIIIGYTVYAPIAYTDESTKQFTGFDTELAREVFKWLNNKYGTNITIEFTEIEWATKVINIEKGDFDLIWNGMTITEEIKTQLTVSLPYLNNRQVAVVRSEDKDKYTDIESLKSAVAGCEDGSAGHGVIDEKGIGKKTLTFKDQLSAYNQLLVGGVDVIVIDSIMAGYYIANGK